jgi:hypothetical protein
MTVSMCNQCSIQLNPEEWSGYPEIVDLCKMCKSFQSAMNNTIDTQATKLGIASHVVEEIELG